jgi:hypothetical protein
MKRSLIGLFGAMGLASLGLASLGGCAEDGFYGSPPGYGGIDYGGYYDGYYGPYAGGYWGSSGLFYFLDRSTGRYRPDSGRHFRREGGPGFSPIQGHAPPASGRDRPGRERGERRTQRPSRDQGSGPGSGPEPRPGPGPQPGQ